MESFGWAAVRPGSPPLRQELITPSRLLMLISFARWLVQHWPFQRGRWRLIDLFSKALLPCDENIAPMGPVLFPFQPYQWNFFFGVYEPETKGLLEILLGPGDVFIDVGANVGYFSAVAAGAVGTSGRVVALEPEPVHYGRLKRLAEINPSYPIDARQMAVSDLRGRMSFYLCDHPGWHSLIADFPQAPIKEVIEVDTLSLDTLLSECGLNSADSVRLVKVDVEGAEHLVLRGAAEAIRQQWVQAFYVEVTPSVHSGELVRLLAKAGYLAFRASPQGKGWYRDSLDQTPSVQENILWISDKNPQLLAKIKN